MHMSDRLCHGVCVCVCVVLRCSDPDAIIIPPVVAPLPPADYAVDLPGGMLETPDAFVIPGQPLPEQVYSLCYCSSCRQTVVNGTIFTYLTNSTYFH